MKMPDSWRIVKVTHPEKRTTFYAERLESAGCLKGEWLREWSADNLRSCKKYILRQTIPDTIEVVA
jgi:hypothetical protein